MLKKFYYVLFGCIMFITSFSQCGFSKLMFRGSTDVQSCEFMPVSPLSMEDSSPDTQSRNSCIVALLTCCMPILTSRPCVQILEATNMAPCIMCYYLNRSCPKCEAQVLAFSEDAQEV